MAPLFGRWKKKEDAQENGEVCDCEKAKVPKKKPFKKEVKVEKKNKKPEKPTKPSKKKEQKIDITPPKPFKKEKKKIDIIPPKPIKKEQIKNDITSPKPVKKEEKKIHIPPPKPVKKEEKKLSLTPPKKEEKHPSFVYFPKEEKRLSLLNPKKEEKKPSLLTPKKEEKKLSLLTPKKDLLLSLKPPKKKEEKPPKPKKEEKKPALLKPAKPEKEKPKVPKTPKPFKAKKLGKLNCKSCLKWFKSLKNIRARQPTIVKKTLTENNYGPRVSIDRKRTKRQKILKKMTPKIIMVKPQDLYKAYYGPRIVLSRKKAEKSEKTKKVKDISKSRGKNVDKAEQYITKDYGPRVLKLKTNEKEEMEIKTTARDTKNPEKTEKEKLAENPQISNKEQPFGPGITNPRKHLKKSEEPNSTKKRVSTEILKSNIKDILESLKPNSERNDLGQNLSTGRRIPTKRHSYSLGDYKPRIANPRKQLEKVEEQKTKRPRASKEILKYNIKNILDNFKVNESYDLRKSKSLKQNKNKSQAQAEEINQDLTKDLTPKFIPIIKPFDSYLDSREEVMPSIKIKSLQQRPKPSRDFLKSLFLPKSEQSFKRLKKSSLNTHQYMPRSHNITKAPMPRQPKRVSFRSSESFSWLPRLHDLQNMKNPRTRKSRNKSFKIENLANVYLQDRVHPNYRRSKSRQPEYLEYNRIGDNVRNREEVEAFYNYDRYQNFKNQRLEGNRLDYTWNTYRNDRARRSDFERYPLQEFERRY